MQIRLAGQAAIQRHIVSSSDAGQVDGKSGAGTDSFKDEGFASQYAIPLIAKGQIQGILQLCHRTELNPGQDWLDFLDTLAVGEESGQMAESMGVLARQYQEQARAALAILMMLAGWAVWAAIATLLIVLIFRMYAALFSAGFGGGL